MKAILTLKRDTYTSKTTIGKLYLNDTFICDTLEDVCRDINRDGDLDDAGALTQFDQKSDVSNTTYYLTDKIHLTNAGYDLVSSLIEPTVRGLIL